MPATARDLRMARSTAAGSAPDTPVLPFEGNVGVWRLSPKLIRVADDLTIWTSQYEIEPSELESTHADIARRVGTALNLAPAESLSPARVTADPDAYLAYLRGIAAFQQSWSDTSLQAHVRRELEDAVARDPAFALAWSWLAHVYSTQYNSGADRTPAVRDAASRAARTAIALAPRQAEPHVGLARVLMVVDRDYDEALREIEVARRARPELAEAIRVEAWLRQRRGEWAASLALQMRAFDLDPAASSDLVAIHYLHWRNYPQANRFIAIASMRSGAWRRPGSDGQTRPSAMRAGRSNCSRCRRMRPKGRCTSTRWR